VKKKYKNRERHDFCAHPLRTPVIGFNTKKILFEIHSDTVRRRNQIMISDILPSLEGKISEIIIWLRQRTLFDTREINKKNQTF